MECVCREERRKQQLSDLGSNVGRCRELRCLGRKELVILSGVSSSVIAGIEAPNMFTSHKVGGYLAIAEALEVYPHVLFNLTSNDTYDEKIMVQTSIPRKERIRRQLYMLGSNLKHYRNQEGLEKHDLANLSGLSESTINRIEAPNIFTNNTMGTWIALADALEMPLHTLFDFTKGDLQWKYY